MRKGGFFIQKVQKNEGRAMVSVARRLCGFTELSLRNPREKKV
jgi:hypothetical protein